MRLAAPAAALVLGIMADPLAAQSARPGGTSSAVTAQSVAQIQQLAAERTRIEAENSSLQQELEQARAELGKLRGELGSQQQRAQLATAQAARLSSSNDSTTDALQRSRAQLEELVARFRTTAQSLADVEAAAATSRAQLAANQQSLGKCVDANAGLYDLNDLVLARLEDRGVFSRIGENASFTRLARTRLENLIDEYRYRAAELKLVRQPATDSAASAASAAASTR